MIDIDVARKLKDAGLEWAPADGDHFVIDVGELRDEPFMLSSMVVERASGRSGLPVLRFNGTTEWALDSVEQHEALWIPREEQLREALGEAFRSLVRGGDGVHAVRIALEAAPDSGEEAEREVRAPSPEDAYAGALLVLLTHRGTAAERDSSPTG